MAYFGIPNKLIRLRQVTMENSTYHVKIGTVMTVGFQVGTGLKQGDELAPNLFVGTNHINNILQISAINPLAPEFYFKF